MGCGKRKRQFILKIFFKRTIEIINKIFARDDGKIIDFRISKEASVLIEKKTIFWRRCQSINIANSFSKFSDEKLVRSSISLKNKMSDNEKTLSRKRKAESEITGEVEIFLKIFVGLTIKDPEDSDKLLEKTIDNTDGAALDAIIFAVSKLRELLQSDIDSLKLPHALKVSIKLLKTFIEFTHQSKLLKTLK